MKTDSAKAREFDDAIINERLTQLELTINEICIDMNNMGKAIKDMNNMLRETQQFAVKVAVSQRHLQDRVMQWPFVKIEGRNSDQE
jgi:hypothetical protein